MLDSGAEGRVQIAAATLLGNSLRQTAHTHCASCSAEPLQCYYETVPRASFFIAGGPVFSSTACRRRRSSGGGARSPQHPYFYRTPHGKLPDVTVVEVI